MMRSLRIIKVGMVGTIALFFSLVALDNLIDDASNFPAVQHVLSMDTTFHVPVLMQRAITSYKIQRFTYYLISVWELFTAIICWLACFRFLITLNAEESQFNQAKTIALLGLFFGFILYMLGFVVIAGEWFNMWQSPTWNAQPTAGLFASLILLMMIFLSGPDSKN